MSFFETLNVDGSLDGLDVDREEWLGLLGLYDLKSGKMQFLDLHDNNIEELSDLMMQSLSYIEFISEKMSLCDKRRRDAEADMEVVLNRVIASSSGLKITEAKALAKGKDEYQIAYKRFNTLASYHDWLKRFSDIIDKYHYAVKNRIQAMQAIKDKYGLKD